MKAEPGLASSAQKFVGGLRLPGDETGDAFMFTQRLAALAADAGVTFHYDTAIRAMTAEGGRITGIETSRGRMVAESYVVSLGSYSPAWCVIWGLTCPSTRSRLFPHRRDRE